VESSPWEITAQPRLPPDAQSLQCLAIPRLGERQNTRPKLEGQAVLPFFRRNDVYREFESLSLRQNACGRHSLLSMIGPEKPSNWAVFSWMAVHLGLAPEARNHSLTPGFLCGRSLGPFGTHLAFCQQISSLADRGQTQSLQFLLLAEIQGR
jgi:hypothetical protein